MIFIQEGMDQIQTDRLILRNFRQSDVPDMLKNWIADPEVQFGCGEHIRTTKVEVLALVNAWENQCRCAIVLKETDENIGHISFCRLYTEANAAEIEYCIAKVHWGKGIVTEALRAFIQHIFISTTIVKLEAIHSAENLSAGRVLQKSGFNPMENVLRYSHLEKPPENDVCYAITREQFTNRYVPSNAKTALETKNRKGVTVQ